YIDPYTPATDREDEIGDLARQLKASYAPPEPEPVPEPEPEYVEDADDVETSFDSSDLSDPDFDDAPKPRVVVASPQIVADEDEEDDPCSDLHDESLPDPIARPTLPVAPSQPQYSAVLAVQLGSREQLRRLPRARLTELL